MKKLLSAILAVALVLSCLGMISFAAGESKTEVKAGSMFIDFEGGETDLTNYINSESGGTLTYAPGKGVDGSAGIKFVGDKSWYAPNVMHDTTVEVMDQPSTYRLTFDIYYETLPTTIANGLALITRYTGGYDTLVYTIPGSTNLQANKWYTLSVDFLMSASGLAKENVSLYLDRVSSNSETVCYLDNFKIEKVSFEKGIVNGNAEAGTAEFGVFSASDAPTITSVDGGANGTAKAIKVVAKSQWQSVAYNVSKAIVDVNGYNGDGATKYTLKMWLKADEATTLKLYLNSQRHGSSTDAWLKTALGYTDGSDVYISSTYFPVGSSIEVTTEWKEYTFEFEVGKDWYEMMKTLSNTYADALDLVLRFEDAKGAARPAYYLDEITLEKWVEATPSATPVATPEPLKVVNGNVETGTTKGWDNPFKAAPGAVTTVVQPGANGTKNAVKVDISGNYQTVTFDLGPAIINDPEFNYHGAGAGVYTVSFWAKAQEGHEGIFRILLNSNNHKSSEAAVTEIIGEKDYATITFVGEQDIELTDEWELFEIDFNISEYFLKTLRDLRTTEHAKNTEQELTYQLLLRFDGAYSSKYSDRPFNGADTFFSYYVDEVTIEAPESDAVIDEPSAVTFTAKEDYSNSQGCFFKTGSGVASVADVKNGVYSKSFTVKNECDETISLSFVLQTVAKKADGSNTWAGPMSENFIELEPGEEGTIEFEMDVENGQVEVLDAMYDLSTFFYRFDLRINGSGAEVPEGTSFTIFCEGNDNAKIAAITSNSWTATIRTNYTASGDVAPVAFIAVAVVAVLASVAVVVIKKRKED